MLCNKEFKNFADSIRDIDKFYNYITRYCRLKFMSIRDKMSKDNVNTHTHIRTFSFFNKKMILATDQKN